MSQKPKKNNSPWLQCDNCSTFILNKDLEIHSNDCPPNLEKTTHQFVQNNVLFGILELKANEDFKDVFDKNNLVFLSQATIQLCCLAIGEWVCLDFGDKLPKVAKVVWPTFEKTLTSVLLTKQGLELLSVKASCPVKVSRLPDSYREASQIVLVLLNGPKSLQIGQELNNRIQKAQLGKFYCIGNKFCVMFYGKLLQFEVKSLNSCENLEASFDQLNLSENPFFQIGEKTCFTLFKNNEEFCKAIREPDLISQIGGLDAEMGEIRDTIKAYFGGDRSNFRKTRTVLLYGNAGTGKTLLANALALETKLNLIKLSPSDLYSKHGTSPEESIRILFGEAEKCPSIIIIDEFDILAPIRTVRMTDTEKRIIATLLTTFDSLDSQNVFILATSSRPDSIDPAFRRCGRLDREIEIPIPNSKGRCEILKRLVKANFLGEIAEKTHGFVGADLVALCQRADLLRFRSEREQLSLDDFLGALKLVKPSAMREVQVEVSNVKWADIGGQDGLKLALRQAVEWPIRHPHCFKRLGITPPKGVLMFGPPGCSKTMVAKALATESGLNFLSIKGPELFSKWVGESERAVRETFRKARQVAPSIIFFDEIDAIGGERGGGNTGVQERVLAQLLTELDGVSPLGDVTVLAATNRPDRIDKALLRPGRLDRIVYVPLPDWSTRREIFRLKLAKMPIRDVDLEGLVNATESYSGAEINAICHEAAMAALENDLGVEWVEERHFKKALELVRPRTPDSLIKLYENYLKL